MAADDRVAATLAGIRERGYRNGATGALCARLSDAAAVDVPRLLAAVEAATRLHSKWEIREDDGEGDLERLICRHCCAADGGGQTEGCADEHAAGNCWPCPTCRAITAALTGTQPSEDGDHD